MADRRELLVGGKPISSLRVVDLKVELEKRSLPKSGSKKDLLERLRLHLQLEEDREAALQDEEHVPNLSLCNETENDFIREYLAAQQARFQVQREAKKQFEDKKRESEASAEETTQDEDEQPSEVSPSKKSPRKTLRPQKKDDSSTMPHSHKSALEFQTPDSLPYSTPPLEKRDEDAASHDDEEDVRTPLARKHKLLKYVEQPQQSGKVLPQAGRSDSTTTPTGAQFSIRELVDKFETGSGPSEQQRRDPPPSSLYGEAINLKMDKKEESPPAKKDERRVLRGRSGGSAAPAASAEAEVPKVEEQVFSRLVQVCSENDPKKVEAKQETVVDAKRTPTKEKTPQKEEAPPVVEAATVPVIPVEKPKVQETAPVATAETISPQRATRVSPKKLEKPVATEAKPEVEKVITPTKVEAESVAAVLPRPPPLEKMGMRTAKVQEESAAPVLVAAPTKVEVIKATPPPLLSVPSDAVAKQTVAQVIEQKKVESSPPKPKHAVVEEKSVQPPLSSPKVSPEKISAVVQEKVVTPATTPTKPTQMKMESPKSSEKVKSTMAIDHERSPLVKPEIAEKTSQKVEPPCPSPVKVVQVQPEDTEEDELQVESGEMVDDSLKITNDDDDDVDSKSRSSSRSRSTSRSSIDTGRARNERSGSPSQNHQQQKATDGAEAVPRADGAVRKWKIRKQSTGAEADQGDNGAPRKRRWGTSQLLPNKKPALVISTDSLKTIVPDAKPLSAEEVRLGSPNFQSSSKSSTTQDNNEEEATTISPAGTKPEKVEFTRRVEVSESVSSVKPEVVLAAAAPLLEATSPAQQPRACVVHVSNLVRPFTIPQLKELLARTGHLIDGKFWIDKVKSSCLVQYETEEEAEETRAALHGIHWPTSNPKTLVVDYSTAEELENRLSGKDTSAPPIAKVEPTLRTAAAAAVQSIEARRGDKAGGVREWDMGKVGETAAERREATTKDAHHSGDEEPVKAKDEVPAKLLDDLFRKTKASPSIYWLPLTDAQIAEKEAMRRQRLVERETRLRENQQRRDEEFQQRQREREKQREAERERQRARDKERERQRTTTRKRSRSSSSSSSDRSSPNKRRTSKTPPRRR